MTDIVPSNNAIAMIEHFEIGDQQVYTPHPSWPGGASGVTIGVGYDLGYTSSAQIDIDWVALPEHARHRLQSCAGYSGAVARSLLPAVIDIAIPISIALEVFEQRDIPRTVQMTLRAFRNCIYLSEDSFGSLVSLVFNRGVSMVDTQPNANRLEMRQIRDAMMSSDFSSIPAFIRNMKRLWRGKGLDGLLVRRDAEADMFEAGLSAIKI